jgi:hypothetical protein
MIPMLPPATGTGMTQPYISSQQQHVYNTPLNMAGQPEFKTTQ